MISLKFGIWLLLLYVQIKDTYCKGKISLKLLEYNNPTGTDAKGDCCDSPVNTPGCTIGTCDHLFRICLLDSIYNSNTSNCLQSTEVTTSDKNVVKFDQNQQNVTFVFDTWKGEAPIQIVVFDSNTDDKQNVLIDQFLDIYNSTKAGFNQTSTVAVNLNLIGARSKNPTSLRFSLSVYCDPQYYGSDCSKKCVPTNKCEGHYTCDHEGNKVCLSGWRGTDCTEQVPGSDVDCSVYTNKTEFSSSDWVGMYSCDNKQHSYPFLLNATKPKDSLTIAATVSFSNFTVQVYGTYSSWSKVLALQVDTSLAYEGHNLTKISLETREISTSGMIGQLSLYKADGGKLTCIVDPLSLEKAYFDGCDFKGTCVRYGKSKENYYCCCNDGTIGTSCTRSTMHSISTTKINAQTSSTTTDLPQRTTKPYANVTHIKQTIIALNTRTTREGHYTGTSEPTTDSVRWNLTSAAERHDVSCLSDSISVFIPSDLLSHYQTTWRDPHCQVHDNGTHYVSTISHTSCGTTVIFTKDEVIFENELILHKSGSPSNQTSNGSIDFGSSDSEVIPVQCIYPRRQNISTLYRPAQSTVRFYEKRYGHMDVQLEQYKSGMFVTPLPVRSFPNEVEINKDMYFILHAMHVNSTDVAVKVDSCVATPSNMPADGRIYQLLDQGCPASPAVKVYPSAFDEVRFSVRAFEFRTSPGGIVYIHCQVSVCSPTSPQCRVGCAHRHRREVSTEDGGSHLVSGGPYLLVADKGGLQVSTVVAGVCASVAVVATVIAIIGWRRKSSASTSSSKL